MTKISPRRAKTLAARASRRELDAARFSSVVKAITHKPVFVEAEDGQRIRVWSDCTTDAAGRKVISLDVVRDEDVRAWLLGNRVTSIREGLEFVHEKYARGMIRDGFLRPDSCDPHQLWITDKAAERFNLPPVMGCKFPPATGTVGRLAQAA